MEGMVRAAAEFETLDVIAAKSNIIPNTIINSPTHCICGSPPFLFPVGH